MGFDMNAFSLAGKKPLLQVAQKDRPVLWYGCRTS